MRTVRLAALALAATLALTACQTANDAGLGLAVEPASEVERLAADGARPWKVSIDWGMDTVTWAGEPFLPADVRSTFDGRCATPSDYVVSGAGDAQASHMGRVAFTYEHCALAIEGTWEGFMNLTAADGSTLATVYSGMRGFDFETMEYLLYMDFVIVGGTRRFDGATGGGPGGARVAQTTMMEVFAGEATMPLWIDGDIVYAPGKAQGR